MAANSLFIQVIDQENHQLLLNKKYIVSALNIRATKTEVKTITGDKFDINYPFGDLTFQLLNVEHKNDQKE